MEVEISKVKRAGQKVKIDRKLNNDEKAKEVTRSKI